MSTMTRSGVQEWLVYPVLLPGLLMLLVLAAMSLQW
jgi:hypothetical protein